MSGMPIYATLGDVMTGEDDASASTTRDRVRAERRRRGWSIRQASDAATAAGARISNTTWGAFEKGEAELSGRLRGAVAAAFTWPLDWAEVPPVVRPPEDVLRDSVELLAARVQLLASEFEDQGQLLAALAARLDRLEQRRAR